MYLDNKEPLLNSRITIREEPVASVRMGSVNGRDVQELRLSETSFTDGLHDTRAFFKLFKCFMIGFLVLGVPICIVCNDPEFNCPPDVSGIGKVCLLGSAVSFLCIITEVVGSCLCPKCRPS